MAEFEDKLNSVLSNPQMMQQIMSMAGSFSQPTPAPPQKEPASTAQMPFDPGAMQGMMELLRGTQLDRRQQNLLNALGAYLPCEKISRLQKAMQASRVAKYASAALNRNAKAR